MQKVTGHYGSSDKIKAKLHAVFVVENAQPFNAMIKAACPDIAAIVKEAREQGDFSGKCGESLPVVTAGAKFLLLGLGEQDKVTLEILRRAAGRAAKAAAGYFAPAVALYCPPDELLRKQSQITFEEAVEALVTGAVLVVLGGAVVIIYSFSIPKRVNA